MTAAEKKDDGGANWFTSSGCGWCLELQTKVAKISQPRRRPLLVLVKVLVDAFNQEKVLVEAFSVIVETSQTFVCSSTGAWCEDCWLGWSHNGQWAGLGRVGVSTQATVAAVIPINTIQLQLE